MYNLIELCEISFGEFNDEKDRKYPRTYSQEQREVSITFVQRT